MSRKKKAAPPKARRQQRRTPGPIPASAYDAPPKNATGHVLGSARTVTEIDARGNARVVGGHGGEVGPVPASEDGWLTAQQARVAKHTADPTPPTSSAAPTPRKRKPAGVKAGKLSDAEKSHWRKVSETNGSGMFDTELRDTLLGLGAPETSIDGYAGAVAAALFKVADQPTDYVAQLQLGHDDLTQDSPIVLTFTRQARGVAIDFENDDLEGEMFAALLIVRGMSRRYADAPVPELREVTPENGANAPDSDGGGS